MVEHCAMIRQRRRIGLVAHDNMKADLLEWARYNRPVLATHHLVGTGTTGGLISESLGLTVERLRSGPLGGDQQLGAMIAGHALDVLVFFWDPLSPQPHDPDVKALLRIAVVWNLPVACNRATADYLISSPLLVGTYERAVPVYPDVEVAPTDAAPESAGEFACAAGRSQPLHRDGAAPS